MIGPVLLVLMPLRPGLYAKIGLTLGWELGCQWPRVPARPLAKESSTRLHRMHPRANNQIEATNPPSEKSRLEGAKIPSLIWPPWCQFSWPNCWPRKGQGKRRSVNLQKDCAIPDSHRWWNQKKTINQVQVIVLNPLIRKINQVFLICISDEIGRRSTSQVIKWLFLQVLTKRSETNVDSIIVSTTKPSFQDLREPWVGTWSALVSPPAASPTWSTRGLPAPSRQPAGPGRAMAPTCNTNLRHPAALRSRSHIPDGQSEMLRLLCPIARAHDPVRPCTRHPECCWLAGIKFEACCQYSGYLATLLLPSQLLIFHSSHNSTTSVCKREKLTF